jgi:glyoxylase I family protein
VLTRGAHHHSLCVTDVERAREFYGELLGLPEIERPDFGFPGAWFQAGEIQLHLIQAPEGVDVGSRPRQLTPLAGHLAFEIADFDACEAHLRASGIEILSLGARVGQMFVQDPDGNVVELIRPGGQLGRG